MPTGLSSNKAKIAKRVIEVLEFFDAAHPDATVMDIVRRYKRPQSSTSELLSSLVDLGLLYKDATTRSYTLTPRAAMLGASVQPTIVRSGKLTGLIDRLAAQTGLSVAVFGMIGLNAQIFTWRGSARPPRTSETRGFCGGLQDGMTSTAAGWLLLSTVAQPRRDGLVRRLNAEAADEMKFSFGEMTANVQSCIDNGFAIGPAGYGSSAEVAAVLIPGQGEGRPMAVGFVYDPAAQIDAQALVGSLKDAVRHAAHVETFIDDRVQPIAVGAASAARA